MEFDQKEWDSFVKVLRALAKDPFCAPDIQTMKTLVAKVNKKARKMNRKEAMKKRVEQEKEILRNTAMVAQRADEKPKANIFENTDFKAVPRPKRCYVCAEHYTHIHFYYHRLCPSCATLNYEKRKAQFDLTGMVVLVTGGRVKIGYETVLKFLRNGARVLVTTRFPVDALKRFSKLEDFEEWKGRLSVFGLDFRNIIHLENFLQFLTVTEPKIDVIVNNAAQTLELPPDLNEPLYLQENERHSLPQSLLQLLEPGFGPALPNQEPAANLPSAPIDHLIDQYGQPYDFRESNSWRQKLDDVKTQELLEVNLINNIAPFLINSRLKPVLEKTGEEASFIINVTSVEGQFSYRMKTEFHPHTNMTKAALNMMTCTSAEDYAESNIYMNSVDVGWVSSNNPYEKRKRLAEKGFSPPLDFVDAAARILDPIFESLQGVPTYGKLYKNYKLVDW